MKQHHTYSRGTLATMTGVNLETIRFYEKLGLMPDPPRSKAGYRCYSQDHLKRLHFIKRSRELGFSNKEVKGLLEMVDGHYNCNQIKAIALDNIEHISKKIADLAQMQAALREMANACSGNETPDCAIVECLMDI